MIHLAADYFTTALANGGRQRCLDCRAPITIRVVAYEQFALSGPIPHHFLLAHECPNCGPNLSVAFAACWAHPIVQQFTARHPRWVMEPDTLERCAGQPAIRMRLVDFLSAARLTIFAHPQTLQVLATFEE